MKNLDKLESSIGYSFKNRDILILALTHSSAGKVNNERLELLGDSIENYYMTYLLYIHFPNIYEGDLSIKRSYMVKKTTLIKIAKDFKLHKFIILGKSEIKNGVSDTILANVVESLIGAILIDSNIIVVGQVIILWFKKYFQEVTTNKSLKDFKTKLQEYLQKNKHELPCYKVKQVNGEKHKQEYMMQCVIKHLPHIKIFGYGYSKKKAEQESAKQALKALGLE